MTTSPNPRSVTYELNEFALPELQGRFTLAPGWSVVNARRVALNSHLWQWEVVAIREVQLDAR